MGGSFIVTICYFLLSCIYLVSVLHAFLTTQGTLLHKFFTVFKCYWFKYLFIMEIHFPDIYFKICIYTSVYSWIWNCYYKLEHSVG